MRSYCVIPHSAREDGFFDAVFEDGVRVQHEGRLLPLPFSHVLSPAHDLAKHINGPLLEAVRDGHNAMLLVALPAATAATAARSTQRRPARGTEPPAPPLLPASSSALSSSLQDCTQVAMELYTSLLPLLFHNASGCRQASVSVVTASAQDRTVVDELPALTGEGSQGGRRVRGLREVSWKCIPREHSATEWGSVLSILSSRHAALAAAHEGDEGSDDIHSRDTAARAAAAFAGQTACVVTVQLEDGYGRVVLVDGGSDQELLQALTLILGTAGGGNEADGKGRRVQQQQQHPMQQRTYPARTPLLTLLQENVSTALMCAVHVVAVPNPVCEAKNSLRVMRFASDAVFYGDGAVPAAAPPPRQKSKRQADAAGANDNSTRSSSSKPSPIPARAAGVPTPSSSSFLTAQHTSADSQPGQQQQAATPAPLPPAPHTTTTALPHPPSQLPCQPHVDPQAQSREQYLLSRVAALEAQLRELSSKHATVQGARERVEAQVDSLKASLREKQDAWLQSQEANAAMQKEHSEFAALVPKLLKKISALERRRDELVAAQAAAVKAQRIAETSAKGQEDTIVALRRNIAALERRETQRVRQATLQRISPSEEADASAHTNRGADGSPGRDRVASIAVEELRRRNKELGRLLAAADARAKRLEERVAQTQTATAAAAAPAGRSCARCSQLQERLAYFMKELADTRKEKDQLAEAVVAKDQLHAAQAHTHDRAGPVGQVLDSLLSGCASLHSQLLAIHEAVSAGDGSTLPSSRPRGDRGAGIDPSVVAEHMRAVEALEQSIREIGTRRCVLAELPHSSKVTEAGVLTPPTCATAADVAALTAVLTFETERTVHLRAFLPTFAQLAVATEHLRMRLAKASKR